MKTLSMEEYRAAEAAAQTPERTVVVLGNFDGVHVGHTGLIRAALAEKSRSGGICAVWTFRKPAGNALLITPPEERPFLLCAAGADLVITEDFEKVRGLTPEGFVFSILRDALHASHVVCGYNYRFGSGAKGDPGMLRTLCGQCGIGTTVVDAVCLDGEPVSSTGIRAALTAGDPEKAAKMLGRPYSYCLPVIKGNQFGRTKGFPTVNQCFPGGMLIPRSGVYASVTTVGNEKYPSVTDIGTKPTVSNENKVASETHILGFDGDLYGENVRVELHRYLRPEMKFSSPDELSAAVHADIANAKEIFEAAKNGDPI